MKLRTVSACSPYVRRRCGRICARTTGSSPFPIRMMIGMRYCRDQLAGIGEIAMIWNEVEFLLDTMVGSALVLSKGMEANITSRLGFDPKKDLAQEIARDALLPQAAIAAIKDTLIDLNEHKQFRDAIVHARVSDRSKGIGQIVKRGGITFESLLEAKALNALYDRLLLLRLEMEALVQIYYVIGRASGAGMRGAPGPEKQRREREVLKWTIQAQAHRSTRLALGPLPKFPS
jgi:hypothetical protein